MCTNLLLRYWILSVADVLAKLYSKAQQLTAKQGGLRGACIGKAVFPLEETGVVSR